MNRHSFTATIVVEMQGADSYEAIEKMVAAGRFYKSEFIRGIPPVLILRELVTTTLSGGHVYDQAKTDEGWKPDQKGGVVTAEPASMAKAREADEKQAKDGGGDM